MLEAQRLKVRIDRFTTFGVHLENFFVYLLCGQQLKGSYFHERVEDQACILGHLDIEEGQQYNDLLRADHFPEILERSGCKDVQSEVRDDE